MRKNYLLTAWRSMKRNKTSSFINIAGLSIGIACVIFIVMYIKDELRYDSFFKDVDHIFQVNMTVTDKGIVSTTGGNTAPAVTPTMLSLYPEIESYARIYRPGDVMVRYEENDKMPVSFTEQRLMAVDSNFLDIFNYAFLQGNPLTCLQQPDAVVITAATARKYFGGALAIGKVLLFDVDKKPFVVTGVLKDIPAQSSFQFDLLTPISAYAEVKKRSWNWFWLQVNSYVKLKPSTPVDKASIAALNAKFDAMVKEHAFNKNYGGDYEEFIKKGNRLEYNLMPFTDVHLHAVRMDTPARLTTLGDIKYLYIFGIIAFFIILLACVNFMNLSTAQSSTRAKEVGIRKVLGSERGQLIWQFLSEAMLYSVIATLLSLVIVFACLQPFNQLSGKALSFGSLFSNGTVWIVCGLCVLTGLLAGLYPAFFLTSFNPVEVLKGMKIMRNSFGHLFIRNGLVVFQFTISIILIICTIVVFQQLKYTREKDTGFSKENVIEIANSKRLGGSEEAFRQAVTSLPGVLSASISGGIPTKGNFGDGYVPESTDADKAVISEIGLSSFMVDEHFIPAFDMQVIHGRNFSAQFNDSASVILNETAAKQIGWKEPVGKYLDYPGNEQKFKVIAVVKDFNITSLRERVEPFALFHTSSKTYYVNSSFISVRVQPGNMTTYLSQMEKTWKQFAPNTPFDYSFMDAEWENLYRVEQRMSSVFTLFTSLSIFIACLGLFGLSLFTAERRRREIGIRKVLGATVADVAGLLSRDFLRLVVLAALVAFPVGWLAMNEWLQGFAYRISIQWWMFLLAGALALVIALITISFQSVKAAVEKPVESLKME